MIFPFHEARKILISINTFVDQRLKFIIMEYINTRWKIRLKTLLFSQCIVEKQLLIVNNFIVIAVHSREAVTYR